MKYPIGCAALLLAAASGLQAESGPSRLELQSRALMAITAMEPMVERTARHCAGIDPALRAPAAAVVARWHERNDAYVALKPAVIAELRADHADADPAALSRFLEVEIPSRAEVVAGSLIPEIDRQRSEEERIGFCEGLLESFDEGINDVDAEDPPLRAYLDALRDGANRR